MLVRLLLFFLIVIRSTLPPFKSKFMIIARKLLNALLYFNSFRSRASIIVNPLNSKKNRSSIIRRFWRMPAKAFLI